MPHKLLIRRSRVARVQAMTFLLAALLLLLASGVSVWNGICGLAVLMLAFSERRASTQFMRDPLAAATRGAWDQLGIIALAGIYCAVGIASAYNNGVYAELMREVAPDAREQGLTESEIAFLVRATIKLTYIVLFVLTAGIQGSVATFYLRTRKVVPPEAWQGASG